MSSTIEALLEAGRQQFQMAMGIVSHVAGKDYTVKYFVPADAGLHQGQVFESDRTYCDITLRLRIPVGIHHMQQSEHHLHPCYEVFRLESYIGTPLYIGDEMYGTVNFSSPTPRLQKFTNADRDYIRDLASKISALLPA
jgi:GAF domain-containing protein